MTTTSNAGGDQATTPVWQIGALWLMVTLPAAWGFIETVLKSVVLFTG
ncbi:hypothetical protein [Salinisphaera japonica]|uniref:Oxalate:formate antiporter n=1 Tax=Salinisphaera japonica YTM-1 TaxID=1209778 RepID=A0A423PN96_9GAMM|nr:hypothetical protein [Salinisphaera japonica]ROO27095.1 hypothetical protein SAJA_09990 [Salinisphaera japonica YTM-1]